VLEFDYVISDWAARLLENNQTAQKLLVDLGNSNFTKALCFAPFLLVGWYRGVREEKTKVLSTLVSCALSLMITWCLTTTWLRHRPVDPAAGIAHVSGVFSQYFEHKPNIFRWGCFPSDHAAYLTALSLGLFTINKKAGIAALIVSVCANGLFRMAVGLHYLSDFVGGVALGCIVHWLVFHLFSLQNRKLVLKARDWVEGSMFLQAFLIFCIVEMSVLFSDIRFLDEIVFNPF